MEKALGLGPNDVEAYGIENSTRSVERACGSILRIGKIHATHRLLGGFGTSIFTYDAKYIESLWAVVKNLGRRALV